MDYDPVVLHEWHVALTLSPRALRWIAEHPEPGDLHPIATALAALRAGPAAG